MLKNLDNIKKMLNRGAEPVVTELDLLSPSLISEEQPRTLFSVSLRSSQIDCSFRSLPR